MEPQWLTVKVAVRKGCSVRLESMIVRIGRVSHHLGPLLGAVELIVLCDFFLFAFPIMSESCEVSHVFG